MKLRLYSIRDCKTGYMAPRVCPNDESAVRDFLNICKSPEPNALNQSPEDFSLHFVGELDQDCGEISSSQPVWLADAIGNAK